MSRYKFNEDEVPYTILEEFGLNQEMIEDLPVDVYRDILNGRLSPVLPIRVTDRDGNTVTARQARIHPQGAQPRHLQVPGHGPA